MPAAPAVVDARPSLDKPLRRPYIDWLRGVGVLIMIEAHIADSWTLPAERESPWYFYALMLGGIGAPIFLFLAGTAVALSASAKASRLGSPGAATRAVQRRGLEIFALALLFRLQAMILSLGSFRGLLKVDILNIMGPSIVLSATLWGLARSTRVRLIVLGAVTIAFTLLTPWVRAAAWLGVLPDPLESYLRPAAGLTTFALFPWAGLVTAGTMVGVVLATTNDARQERRLIVWLSAIGLALVLAGYAASLRPSPYANTFFWTTSPSYFMLRIGVLLVAVGLSYLWNLRPAPRRWSPMLQFGRTSLFVYWIHVEMVYGLIATPIKRSLTLPWLIVAFLLFTAFLVWLSVLKDRFVERRQRGLRASGFGPQAKPLRG